MSHIEHLERCYLIECYVDEDAFEGTKLDLMHYLVAYNESQDDSEKLKNYLLATYHFPDVVTDSKCFHNLVNIVKDAYIK